MNKPIKQPHFLHDDTNSYKSKGGWEIGQSGDRTLKMTVSEEWTYGINVFFYVDTDEQNLKFKQNVFG